MATVFAQCFFDATAAVTRPANTTAYTAGDVVGGAYELKFIGASGGKVRIDFASLLPAVNAIPTGMTSFRRHFYTRTPPSAIADNSPWDLPAGDVPYYLGYIDVGSPADMGSTLYVQDKQDSLPAQLEAGSTSLFCYDVTNGGYTPAANSEVYYMRCSAIAG